MKAYLITYSNRRNDKIDQWLLRAQNQAQAIKMFWQHHDSTVIEIDDIEEDQ